MQDKIQEIMGLVREMGDAEFYAGSNIKDAAMHDTKALEASKLEVLIESKLRELVREPLSDEKVDALWVFCGNLTVPQKVQRRMIARTVEAAHNITSASGEV